MTEAIVVPHRFRGPPTSGNGGYCCGLVAERAAGAVEVTLRAPPPLDHALQLDVDATGCTLRDGERIVAEGHGASLELEVPEPPSYEQARVCSQRYVGFGSHLFPECFVCGPARAEGDGLRIFAGPADGGRYVAAPWVPSESLRAGAEPTVATPIAWAALDCPGYFAAAAGEAALLGRMKAELRALPRVGREHVVLGWALGRQGRKIHAATALFDDTGACIGRAQQTWIALA